MTVHARRVGPAAAAVWSVWMGGVGLAGTSSLVSAQTIGDGPEQVVITASGVERRLFDTPYAVSVVDVQSLRAAGPMVNLSEALARVPKPRELICRSCA